MLSKVFNFCINKFIESYLNSDELQLGFVKEGGTEKSIFIMKTFCNYFNERGSEVYVAALDASKAFDKVNLYGLLIKLCNLGIPKPIVNVLVKMMGNLSFLVKWKSTVSQKINICSGVQQGNVVSPILFNIYMHDLLVKLREAGLGYYISDIFCGALFYADDIVLLSGSAVKLQAMLDICNEYGMIFDIKFNVDKSLC